MSYKRFWILILSIGVLASALIAVGATSGKPAQPGKTQAKVNAVKPTAKTVKKKAVRGKKTVQAVSLPKLIDVGADKCIPCKMMAPVLDGLRKDYRGKLVVEFVDVWKNPDARRKYKIRMIPTQILYDGKGKELSRHEGYFSREDILAQFRKHGVKL